MEKDKNIIVPVYRKLILSIEEASAYSGIGINSLKTLVRKPDCPFAVKKGKQYLIKRQAFEEYINNTNIIEVTNTRRPKKEVT